MNSTILSSGPWPPAVPERLGSWIRPPGSRQSLILYALAGAPGAGKSALARQFAAHLEARGRPALALSLDDYYLGPGDRERQAAADHPALARRGLPGTHDLDRLAADLDALAARRPVALPRYDKGLDAPAPPDPPRRFPAGLTVILEGWCLGARPQTTAAMRDRVLCASVNRSLARAAERLAPWLAGRVLLRPPEWNVVRAWRHEQAMRRIRPAARQSRAAVNRFLHDFRPLVRDQIVGRWQCDLQLVQDNHRRVRAWR